MIAFVSTIVHTGTKSFCATLRENNVDYFHQHFTYAPEVEQQYVNSQVKLYTTYRNPYHVAISWMNHNRDKYLHSQSGQHHWYAQWAAWANFILQNDVEIIDVTKLPIHLGSLPDTHELYPVLKAQDFKTFFNVVPEKAIDFAIEQINRVQHYLSHINLGVPDYAFR